MTASRERRQMAGVATPKGKPSQTGAAYVPAPPDLSPVVLEIDSLRRRVEAVEATVAEARNHDRPDGVELADDLKEAGHHIATLAQRMKKAEDSIADLDRRLKRSEERGARELEPKAGEERFRAVEAELRKVARLVREQDERIDAIDEAAADVVRIVAELA